MAANNFPLTDFADKLPKELKVNYQTNHKRSPVIEQLKVVAALKLWDNRNYRDVRFEVALPFGGRTVFVKVLAKDKNHLVGVECAPCLDLGWLRGRMAQLRGCLPPDSYLVIILPLNAAKRANKAAYLADEVWITDKDNNKVEQTMFISVCHKG
jgi:hypothetical protein